MAYNDYGAFVTMNGKRREDKEDVGVFDSEEAGLPSGARIYANILKSADGPREWWRHSHHGVMGDGSVRCACYKGGLPEVWEWPEGADEPRKVWESVDKMAEAVAKGGAFWDMSFSVDRHDGELFKYTPYVPGDSEYRFDLEYGGYRFEFEHAKRKSSVHDGCIVYPREGKFMPYKAVMTEPDGTVWECEYGSMFGAGWTEYGAKAGMLDGQPVDEHADRVRHSIMRKIEELYGESPSDEDASELEELLEGVREDDLEFANRDDDLGQLCGMLKAMLLMGYDMTWFERFAK